MKLMLVCMCTLTPILFLLYMVPIRPGSIALTITMALYSGHPMAMQNMGPLAPEYEVTLFNFPSLRLTLLPSYQFPPHHY